MNNIPILKSVFYRKTGNHWERNLFWRDITETGKRLIVDTELDNLIYEDFKTDRYLISSFLDAKNIWHKFDSTATTLNFNSLISGDSSISFSNSGWMTTSREFTLLVFYQFLGQLECLAAFREFIFRERYDYHEDCCNCGFPIIIPGNIELELLEHIARR
ncbi:hypothetical protein [Thalassotalea maritima]|uniref:hypothetical protein n=1 Tax=Thalassotalea maritima TaxID=3242416 RepID=UPI0035294875